jgi:hypothetical protein
MGDLLHRARAEGANTSLTRAAVRARSSMCYVSSVLSRFAISGADALPCACRIGPASCSDARSGGDITAVYDRRRVCFASSRVPPSHVETAKPGVAFDVAIRTNSKGGTNKPTPTLNQTLPFRERLGCSPNEACIALGIGRTFLYDLIAERRVEVRKLGRRTIVSIPSLLKLMDGQA